MKLKQTKGRGTTRGASWLAEGKETKIEEVGKLHTKGGIGIHASKKGKQRHKDNDENKLALQNSYEDACDVVFIFVS